MKIISLISLFVISISMSGQSIEGKVFDKQREKLIALATVELWDSAYVTTVAKGMTDNNGKFVFTNISSGFYCIRILNIGYHDTILRSIKINEATNLEFDIHRFCQYDVSLKNKTCPTCHKKSKVIPIVYGLLISKNGADPFKNEGKTFKAGGCSITWCDPHWYCKRDKKEF